MHTEVSETGRFERTLTIQLEESELESAKTKAARKISGEMKIKGFRPGKAPRSIVERMVGADHLRSEAIEEAIPDTVGAAIDESGLDPATIPSVSAIRDRDEGGVEVDVLVTLWPVLDAIPDFDGRRIEIEPPVVSQEEIDHQVDALRNQFADLEDVDRAAVEGDFVTIDVSAYADGVEIPEAAASDLLYEIDSRSFFPGLDEILVGAGVGDIVEGEGTLPDAFTSDGDRAVTLRALVKEVKAKQLPELTDEFVSDVTEFETADELLATIDENLLVYKVQAARSALQEKAVEQLVADVDLEIPRALVDAETEARVRNLLTRLESDNIGFEDYLRIIGRDQADFVEDTRKQAISALSTRVVLESIIAIDGMGIEDDEYREALESIAAESEMEVADVEKMLVESGQIESLTGDILRRKAHDRIADAAVPVDAEGNTIDLTPVAVDEEDDEEVDDDTTGDDGQDQEPSPEIEE
ncbi:MAG: trigger factor [Actinomycetota bacterium]|nr:trigger factor [Actinomycetota bacterium]